MATKLDPMDEPGIELENCIVILLAGGRIQAPRTIVIDSKDDL